MPVYPIFYLISSGFTRQSFRGLIYPFNHRVLGRESDDGVLTAAIRKSASRKSASSIGPSTVNRLLAKLFSEAADLLRQNIITAGDNDGDGDGDENSKSQLPPEGARPCSRGRGRSPRGTLSPSSSSCAPARANWRADPRPPMHLRSQCKLAQAVEDFDCAAAAAAAAGVTRFDWGRAARRGAARAVAPPRGGLIQGGDSTGMEVEREEEKGENGDEMERETMSGSVSVGSEKGVRLGPSEGTTGWEERME
ncbi:hypothetical protein VTG60DRAFT_4583 [Thermothelomyces hinnuleus]